MHTHLILSKPKTFQWPPPPKVTVPYFAMVKFATLSMRGGKLEALLVVHIA